MLRSKGVLVESDLSRLKTETRRKGDKFLTHYIWRRDKGFVLPWRWPGEVQRVTRSVVRRTAAQSWSCILLRVRLFFTRSGDQRWGYDIIHQSCRHKAVFCFLDYYIELCVCFPTFWAWTDFTFIYLCSVLSLSLHCQSSFVRLSANITWSICCTCSFLFFF